MIQKIVVTPQGTRTYQLGVPENLQDVDGVQAESEPLDCRSGPSEPPPRPESRQKAAVPQFSEDEIQMAMCKCEGAGRLTRIHTDSGIHGQLLEDSNGSRSRYVLPSGLLPQPVLLERDGVIWQAHTPDGASLKVTPRGEEVELHFSGRRGVFNENTLTYGMQTNQKHRQDTKLEHDSTWVPDRSWDYLVGRTEANRPLRETVQPDGTRVIEADCRRRTDCNDAVEHRNTSYRITETPGGTLEAEFLVELWRDYCDRLDDDLYRTTVFETKSTEVKQKTADALQAVYACGATPSADDQDGSSARKSVKLEVARNEDGSYLLTPASGLAAQIACWLDYLRDKRLEDYQPADQVLIRPFSSNPLE